MSLFDKLFGEKIEITFTDENGIERSRKVLKSDWEQWERDGRVSKMKTIRANVSGLRGVRIEEWTVGIEIDEETVNKFLDEATGELYVLEVLEEGVPNRYVIMKDRWEEHRREAEEIDKLFE